MKCFTKLALAVAVSAASASAFALSPASISSARSAGTLVSVDVSGASATTQVLQDVMVAICDGGSAISHYRDIDDPSSPGKRYNSYSCVVDGANVLISNQSPGSIEGVKPVNDQTPVEFMNVEAGNCTAAGTNGSVTLYNCSVSNTSPNRSSRWFCNDTDIGGVTSGLPSAGDEYDVRDTRCSVPVAGVSDEAPPVFASGVNSADGGSLDYSNLSWDALFIQPFAPVISQTFAEALRAEGKVTAVQPNGYDYPILSKAFIRSAFAVGSKVRASDAAPSLLEAAIPGDIDSEFAAFEQSALVVCRRKLGSGTHVAQNLFYMASPCKAPVSGAVLFDQKDGDYNATDLTTAGSVFAAQQHVTLEGVGSSDLERCYEYAEDGTIADAMNADGTIRVTPGLSLSAMGYQSFGKKKTGAGEGEVLSGETDPQWQYVATNGVAPTILNAANGFHTHYWEATLNRNSAVTTSAQDAVLDEVIAAASSTSAIAAAGAGAKILAKTGTDITPKTSGSLSDSGLRVRFTRSNDCAEPLPNPANPVDSSVYPAAGVPLNGLGSPELVQDDEMY